MDRYELVEGASGKFWEVAVEGAVLKVRFGRIGAAGQAKDKALASAAAAAKERDKLVREKTAKGYRPAGAAAGPAPASAASEAPAAMAQNAAPAAARAPEPAAPEPAAPPEPRVDPAVGRGRGRPLRVR